MLMTAIFCVMIFASNVSANNASLTFKPIEFFQGYCFATTADFAQIKKMIKPMKFKQLPEEYANAFSAKNAIKTELYLVEKIDNEIGMLLAFGQPDACSINVQGVDFLPIRKTMIEQFKLAHVRTKNIGLQINELYVPGGISGNKQDIAELGVVTLMYPKPSMGYLGGTIGYIPPEQAQNILRTDSSDTGSHANPHLTTSSSPSPDLEKRLSNLENGIYKGEYKNGLPNGQGTMTFLNGEKYVGQWENGLANGHGTNVWPSGEKYTGEWKDNKQHGKGTNILPNGEKYIGQWLDGKRHGQGTSMMPNGTKYVGQWKNNKPHGQGTYTWPNGQIYTGEWKGGKRHGQGTNILPSGAKYMGMWKENFPHGQGSNIWPDGKKYTGEWKNNKQHGQGTLVLPNGEKYIGQWMDGVM